MTPRAFKDKVRALIDAHGKKRLADGLKIDPANITRWYENGSVPETQVLRAAEILRCFPSDLNLNIKKIVDYELEDVT